MKRRIIVNCQVYKNDKFNDEFPTLSKDSKQFRIELDNEFLKDEAILKQTLIKMVEEKSNDELTYEYFTHEIQNFTIDKLGSQKDFIIKINEQ